MNKIDHLAGVRLCIWGLLFFKLIADFKVLDFYFFPFSSGSCFKDISGAQYFGKKRWIE